MNCYFRIQGGPPAGCATIYLVLARAGADVEDVAHAVAFFASDAAEYITGQSLHVSGGLFMP